MIFFNLKEETVRQKCTDLQKYTNQNKILSAKYVTLSMLQNEDAQIFRHRLAKFIMFRAAEWTYNTAVARSS